MFSHKSKLKVHEHCLHPILPDYNKSHLLLIKRWHGVPFRSVTCMKIPSSVIVFLSLSVCVFGFYTVFSGCTISYALLTFDK